MDAGAPLATLEPTDFENALANAEASFDLAKAQFNRAMQLVEDNYISKTEYDRLRAHYRSKKAELSQAH